MTPRPPLDELLALFRSTVAVEGTTTGAGAVTGDSFIDAALAGAGANSFVSMLAILYPGDPQNVDSRDITAFDNATGEVTLANPYKGVAAAIPVGVPYKIVTFRFVPAEVAAIEAKLDVQKGATGVFYEQADAGINASVVAAEQFIIALTTANTRYILRNLRLKSADPGVGETITVKLYEFINDGETEVDSFVIDHDNYGTHHSLMDIFGMPYIAGDSIRVSLTGSAAGPIVVTGQYSHGKNNV